MFDETIFHPVSGEKGYFVSEEEAEFLKAVVSDWSSKNLASVEVLMGADSDE